MIGAKYASAVLALLPVAGFYIWGISIPLLVLSVMGLAAMRMHIAATEIEKCEQILSYMWLPEYVRSQAHAAERGCHSSLRVQSESARGQRVAAEPPPAPATP